MRKAGFVHYGLLGLLGLPALSQAQPNVTGLGPYTIGITTPDSLNRTDFTEAEPSYVKGTIALPCEHIRSFTSAAATMASVPVANVVLVFYDNHLAKLTCDYSPALRTAFVDWYGPGVRGPVSRVQHCTGQNDKPLLVWGDVWPGAETIALTVYYKGYTPDCRPAEGVRLIIASRRLMALSSACAIQPAEPLVEEYVNAQINKP